MQLINLALLLLSSAFICESRGPVVINPKNPNDPPTLPPNVTKNVLIVGGGLAGLSAALELAERGYSVTIKEKNMIGGKLFSKQVEVLNQTFQVEHGFHAWFHNYFQFHDIRTRLNINSNFKVWEKVNYYFQNYKPEVLYSKGPYPFNLLGIIARSPNLHLTDAIQSTLALPELMFFDYNTVFDKYDKISFHEWAIEKKVAKDFYDIIMQPALSVTLNERTNFSAAEMLVYMQMYFLASSDSDHRETVIYNFYDAVLKPWTSRLLQLKARIIGIGVKSLKIRDTDYSVYGTVDDVDFDKTEYDYVVITTDVGATQTIFNNTINYYSNNDKIRAVTEASYTNSIGKMKIAPPYKVVRVWFDKQLTSDIPDIIETPDFGSVNLIVQYSQLETEYIEWAQKTGGSVVEFHCYTWNQYYDVNATDDQVWSLISPTIFKILPQIAERQFKVLAYHVNSFQNFASFEKGLAQYRPYVTSLKLRNAYLAGDWIRTSYVAQLMEKAVSTGREAANAILLNDRVRQASMTVTNPKGPGI